MLHCAPTFRYERPGLRKPMTLDASASVHESLLTGYVQQSVNFIQICQANIFLPLFDKIHCM